MANVTLKNVYKIYPENIISVNDFSLEIKDKEIIALVGPSGCGKTSTLRLIAGLETITKGEVYIDGKLVNDLEPKERGITMVFQDYALFPHMTVYENIAFGLQPTDLSEADIKERVEQVASITDITHLLKRFPRQLSGGQKQRVALSRSLVNEHKVVLMDEPLSNLDAKLRIMMRAELKRMHDKFNNTFIYVTHNQSEAMAIADRMVVMHDGKIQQVGTPEELYEHPCNLFVAAFLGMPRINLWESKIIERDGGLYFNMGEFFVKLPESRYDKAYAYVDKSVTIGIHPEDIFETTDNDEYFIESQIEVREFAGNKINLHCKTGDNFIIAAVSSDCKAKSGDKIRFSLNPDKIYLFDNETNEAVIN